MYQRVLNMDKTYVLERAKHGQKHMYQSVLNMDKTYVLECVKHGQNICIREC